MYANECLALAPNFVVRREVVLIKCRLTTFNVDLGCRGNNLEGLAVLVSMLSNFFSSSTMTLSQDKLGCFYI